MLRHRSAHVSAGTGSRPQSAWSAGWPQGGARRARQRSHRKPLQAQQQQDEQRADIDFPDFQLPKFRPFTPQNDLQRAMTSFRYWHDCGSDCPSSGSSRQNPQVPGQTLLVTPLTAEWVRAAADLLTESFAESMSAAQFKNYLRRQVRQYLDAHMLLPPKAVVLIALLLPPPDKEPYLLQQQVEADMAVTAASRNDNSTQMAVETGNSSTAMSFSGDGVAASARAGQQQQQQAASVDNGVSDSQAGRQASSSDANSEEGSTAAAASGALLAGVVELSFSASTRSKYLTLTPPEDRPYLCNMAIHPRLRGRGYGTALLQAAESLVAQLGETEVYLHLRVQDHPAARLYKSAGYEEVASDTFLVRFLAMDQRRLLRKRLPKQQQEQGQQRHQRQPQEQQSATQY